MLTAKWTAFHPLYGLRNIMEEGAEKIKRCRGRTEPVPSRTLRGSEELAVVNPLPPCQEGVRNL